MKNIISFGLLAILLTSCATTFRGTRQKVQVSAEPPGAEIVIDQQPPVLDKTEVKLKRKHDHLVVVSKAGCKTETRQISSRGSTGWIVADGLSVFILGIGIPIMIIDAATGSLKELHPDKLHITLSCDE